MRLLHKMSLSLLSAGCLLILPTAIAAENTSFQLVQVQQNTTQGGGSRDFVNIENSARQENEGAPGNPNVDARVDARDISTFDFNDSEGGAWDITFIGIMLIVSALLAVVFLSAWRVHRPVDVFND